MYSISNKFEKPPMELTVGDAKTSGRVYVPKELIGRNVVVGVLPEEKTAIAPPGMSTEELIDRLCDAIGISMEEKELLAKCIKTHFVSGVSTLDVDDIAYDDVVIKLLENVKSMNIGDKDPRSTFCYGAVIGMTYYPHMMREFYNKSERFLSGKDD